MTYDLLALTKLLYLLAIYQCVKIIQILRGTSMLTLFLETMADATWLAVYPFSTTA